MWTGQRAPAEAAKGGQGRPRLALLRRSGLCAWNQGLPAKNQRYAGIKRVAVPTKSLARGLLYAGTACLKRSIAAAAPLNSRGSPTMMEKTFALVAIDEFKPVFRYQELGAVSYDNALSLATAAMLSGRAIEIAATGDGANGF